LPIIPCYSIPEKNNRFRVIFKDEIKIKESGNFDKDVVKLTQKYTKFAENVISSHPEYWLWMHKRWNTRPPGKEGVYDNL
jgi:KDO2-lipid IV(A) lauroyltransferase